MSAPQEVILSTSSLSPYPFQPSASSKPTTSTSTTTQTNSPSSITLHDLQSSTQIHSFKPSNCLSNSVGVVPSRHGQGGGVFVSQENKALLCFWAWQKVSLCSESLESDVLQGH
jgi:pre-rRNA-processing protein IPI3